MPNLSVLNLSSPTQLCLEIPADLLERSWHQHSAFSTSARRWQAYLNQVCWKTFLPWLQQEQGVSAKVWTNPAALPSFWEFVNGTAIHFTTINRDQYRLVLLPSAAIDTTELRVPQEWIDIPDWVADFYLAVQVDPDEGTLWIWGYTNHRKLKLEGEYDPRDRTYSLNREDLNQDLSVLWLSCLLCPHEVQQVEITALPSVSPKQAENLVLRLSSPDVILPRLAFPFPLWAAFLSHGAWRQRLYEQRQGLSGQWSLRQWVQTGVSELAQQVGWRSPTFALARSADPSTTPVIALRRLIIAGQEFQLQVTSMEESILRLELCSLASLIPTGFKLRLLSENLQLLNEAIATTETFNLGVEAMVAPNQGIVWETEPIAEDYDQEILWV